MSEEQLVMVHYGDSDDASAAEHLGECERCRIEFETVRRVLALVAEAPVPERGDDYGDVVWKRLRWRLPRSQSRLRRLAVPLAAAAVLAIVFAAGVLWQQRGTSRSAVPRTATQATNAPSNDRVLLLVVGDHLGRSERMLLEVANADPARPLDLQNEQSRSGELIASNRIYRQTAQKSRQMHVASVLEELEPVLLEIAHSPSPLQPSKVRELQRRIEAKGLLFKVHVIGAEIEDRPAVAKTNEL